MKSGEKILKMLGPGVTTGAADDDPSGIATYSQTGAQFGYGQLWTALFVLPLLIAIQELSARIGAVTGQGIAGIIKTHSNKSMLYIVVSLLFIANTVNIGADLGAMAAALNLLLPINFLLLVIIFSVLILTAQIFLFYDVIANILKWLCLFLLSYPLTMIIIQAPWLDILKQTFIPNIKFNFQFLFILTGVFGTTISPYLFFWQASQEVEENHSHKNYTKNSLKRILDLRIDNFIGMLFSQLTTWSIIAVTATVLHNNGIKDIKTAADAARALEPFVQSFPHAGFIAKFIFALGIIGLGFLAVPILAGSAAYAVGEAFQWRVGFNLKFNKGHAFYGVIILATGLGVLINFLNFNPMKVLVYTAVINGVIAVPLIFIIAQIGNNKKIMGRYQSGKLSNFFVGMTFLGMLGAVIGMFVTNILS
jgi:NRAMP (natural resistance-associated macrophage protein)-like metal ion transporter